MVDTPLELGQLNLIVSNMAATLAFYNELGLTFTNPPGWAEHHTETTLPNGLRLELDSEEFVSKYDPGWRGASQGGPVFLIFSTPTRDGVDAFYEKLTVAGHPSHQPPYDAFWGARYAIVDDPDGNHVGLMSPPDSGYATAPPHLS